MKVAIDDYKILSRCITGYDPYVCMIDDLRSERETEQRNKEYKTKFTEIVKKIQSGISKYFIVCP